MKARLNLVSFAAAALLSAGFAGAASAASPSLSLCNADGKIEVLSQPSGVACGSGAEGEVRALLKARSRYQADLTLAWKGKAMIAARIDRRVGELRREMRRSRG
jgi:hypothetical protein